MSIVTLRMYDPYMRADISDVEEAMSDARDLAEDALDCLKVALVRLEAADMAESGSKLASALACLEDAVVKARSCASPLVQWADRQSGDW